MVGNQLILSCFLHSIEWVEGSLKILIKSLGGFSNLSHDLKSLLLLDTWSKWISGQVSSDSDSSRDDHGSFGLRKFVVLKSFGSHVADMRSTWGMSVVVLDNLIKKFVEAFVRIVGSSISADTRVLVLNTRENAGFE